MQYLRVIVEEAQSVIVQETAVGQMAEGQRDGRHNSLAERGLDLVIAQRQKARDINVLPIAVAVAAQSGRRRARRLLVGRSWRRPRPDSIRSRSRRRRCGRHRRRRRRLTIPDGQQSNRQRHNGRDQKRRHFLAVE